MLRGAVLGVCLASLCLASAFRVSACQRPFLPVFPEDAGFHLLLAQNGTVMDVWVALDVSVPMLNFSATDDGIHFIDFVNPCGQGDVVATWVYVFASNTSHVGSLKGTVASNDLYTGPKRVGAVCENITWVTWTEDTYQVDACGTVSPMLAVTAIVAPGLTDGPIPTVPHDHLPPQTIAIIVCIVIGVVTLGVGLTVWLIRRHGGNSRPRLNLFRAV